MKRKLLKKMSNFSSDFTGSSLRSGVAGLRTMTDDGRFVIGEDPHVKGFFWVAGLGGHGMTACLSVGRLASDLILGKNRGTKLAKAFSPKRFLKGNYAA
jgi:glycine/D-amino acid oxidase-like deaminating enzyme